VKAAARECVQRLGFLWGEPFPDEEPQVRPVPEYHQDYFLNPALHPVLRAWARGERPGWCATKSPFGHCRSLFSAVFEQRSFVDLTPDGLKSRCSVVKALPEREVALVFGQRGPGCKCCGSLGWVHPVT
jgi:hypothetical protein